MPGGKEDSGYAQQGDDGQGQADQAHAAATSGTLSAGIAFAASLASGPIIAFSAVFAVTTGGTSRAGRADLTTRARVSRVSLGADTDLADKSGRQVKGVRPSPFLGSGLLGGQSVYHKADIRTTTLADMQNVTAAGPRTG